MYFNVMHFALVQMAFVLLYHLLDHFNAIKWLKQCICVFYAVVDLFQGCIKQLCILVSQDATANICMQCFIVTSKLSEQM